MTINNRDQIIEQLTELLKQFDKDMNTYQTDVYMYVDDQGFGTLDTFVNVGGNSWLNDDHYTIYSDKEHLTMYDGYYDNDDTQNFANLLGISIDRLEQETREYLGWDDGDNVSSANVLCYLTHTDKYTDKLKADYDERIEECSANYVEHAEVIFEQFETEN